MERRKIFFIGNFEMPDGNANAQLVLGNGRILRDLGYSVVFIGNGGAGWNFSHPTGCYDGFDYYNVRFEKSIIGALNLRRENRKLLAYLEENLDSLFAIFTYGSISFFHGFFELQLWAKKNRVPVVANCADLPSFSHGTILERLAKTADWHIRETIIRRYSSAIIVVSQFLREHYLNSKKPIRVIPPLVNRSSWPCLRVTLPRIPTIVYAGRPFPVDGRKVEVCAFKDRLDWSIDFLSEVHSKGIPFLFHVVGFTLEQYLRVVPWQREIIRGMGDALVFDERKSHQKVKDIVAAADFSIVLRESNTMTNAGFSTKIVESISCGTPIITTDTSDVRERVIGQGLGFLLPFNDREGAIKVLSELLSMNIEERQELKRRCMQSRIFEYPAFLAEMQSILNIVKRQAKR